jgi:hypothetical protein
MSLRRRFGPIRHALAGLVLILAAGAFAAPAGAAPSIAPHFAVYRLTLGKSRGNGAGSVTQARGQIEFQWSEGCDGWTVSQRTRLILTSAQGQDFQSGWSMKAWESKDGLSYRFSIRRMENDAPVEETVGEARLEGPGRGGRVVYSVPEARELVLPEGTLFPTQHSFELLAAAARKDLLLWRTVFDATGGNPLFGVNAAVARSFPSDSPPSFDSPLLKGLPSWRMRLAYFGPDEQKAEPDHEQVQRIYANGVVDEVRFEYPDFALSASLERLDALPPPDCP